MTADSEKRNERVRAILADLLQRRLAESLSEVDSALANWRSGEVSVFEAHGEVLRHVGRAEMVAEQVGHARGDASSLLRQAFDAGLVSRGEFEELVGRPPEEVEPAPTEMPPASLPEKKKVVEDLLSEGPVLVHIDARAEGASVPEQFRADPRLVLRFGYQLSPPIVDFELDDYGIYGTLTFGGVPYRCILPWQAIYAVVAEADQEGMVWPDDVPSAVLADFAPSVATPARRRAASQSEGDHGPPDPSAMPSPEEVKRGSHLKLVK